LMIQRGRTGIAQYVFALVEALRSHTADYQLSLFVLEEDLPLFRFASDFVRTITVPERYRGALRNLVWHQTELPRLSRELSLDVLHLPSYRRLVWSQSIPSVATIHDLAPFRIKGKYDWKRMFYGRVVVKQLAHRQKKIIAISRFTAEDVHHFFGIPRSRITVIHNGIDHKRFSPGDRSSALQTVKHRHQLNHPFLLYTARIEHPAKNHLRLLRAFEEFKRVTGKPHELVFAGAEWHGSEVVSRAVEASPYSNSVRCLGFVPDPHLPDLYRAADLFVFPSLFEGFGFPPLEAMACGCPVLSSDRGALGEVVADAARIVDPESTEEIADGIREMLEPVSRNEWIHRGLIRSKTFDWGLNAEATLRVYQAAAGGAGS